MSVIPTKAAFLIVLLSFSLQRYAIDSNCQAIVGNEGSVVQKSEDGDSRPDGTIKQPPLNYGKGNTIPRKSHPLQLRRFLAGKGVKVNVFLNDQYQSVVKGGLDSESSGRNSASLDIIISFDLNQLDLVPNAEALLHLQSNWGGGINARSGGLFQVNDDADGSIGGHVAQFWYRHHFPQYRTSITIGYLDYQTIIDRNSYANSEDKQFIHQTLDNNPLVPLRIGMGLSMEYTPSTSYSCILGIADGQSRPYKGGISPAFHDRDWYTAYFESRVHVDWPSSSGPLPGNYRLGLFYDPGTRQVFPRSKRDRRTKAGDYGYYASVDQSIFRTNKDSDQGLGLFARFGYRNPENNKMSRFWAAGLSYKGFIPSRDMDVLGFGVSNVRSSTLYRKRVDDRFSSETVYELYYAIHLSNDLVVTPDVQYIDNPGADGDIGHTFVTGVRIRVSF